MAIFIGNKAVKNFKNLSTCKRGKKGRQTNYNLFLKLINIPKVMDTVQAKIKGKLPKQVIL